MKSKKTNTVDTAKPVDISTLTTSDDDCFGKEWESTHKTCKMCSMYDLCMVVTKSDNFVRSKQIRKSYFDGVDWELVPWDVLKRDIAANPGQNYEEVFEVVHTLSKSLDRKTTTMKVKSWLIKNAIKLENKCLYLS